MAVLPMCIKYLIQEIIYYHVSGTSETRIPAKRVIYCCKASELYLFPQIDGQLSIACRAFSGLGVKRTLVATLSYITYLRYGASSNQNRNVLKFNIQHSGSLHSVKYF